jgi:hypothetical protein
MGKGVAARERPTLRGARCREGLRSGEGKTEKRLPHSPLVPPPTNPYSLTPNPYFGAICTLAALPALTPPSGTTLPWASNM